MFCKKLFVFSLAALLSGSAGAVTKTISFTAPVSTNIAIVGADEFCKDFTVNGTTLTCVPTGATAPPANIYCPGDPNPHPPGYVCPGLPPQQSCAGFANVRNLTMNWGNPQRLYTSTVGGMGPNDVVVVTFTTGSTSSPDNNLPSIRGAEWQANPSTRIAVLSSAACDFTGGTLAAYGGTFNNGTSPTVAFAVGTGSNWGYYPKLEPNKTYYFNVKNDANPACGAIGDCNMAFDLVKPAGMSAQSSKSTGKSKSKKKTKK